MPHTVCGLCVDKINDFFEFREMCSATNRQTRRLLGLPVPPIPAYLIRTPPVNNDNKVIVFMIMKVTQCGLSSRLWKIGT